MIFKELSKLWSSELEVCHFTLYCAKCSTCLHLLRSERFLREIQSISLYKRRMNVNHKENPTLVCCIPQTARLVLYYLVRFFTVNQTQTLMNEPKIWHEGVRWEVRWTLWVNSLHLLLGGRHIWAPNLKAAVKTFPSRPRMSTSFGWIVCPLWKSEPNLTEIHFYSKIILACSGSTGQMIVWLYIFMIAEIMLKRVSLAWTTSMYHPHHRHQPTLTPMKKSQLENNNII